MGEIGKSVYEALKDVIDIQIRDKVSDVIGQFNYIHICIPYDENFLSEVEKYNKMYNPHTIIVHSTVAMGTIRKLGKTAVHVPIRGRHPNLVTSIRTFRLYVGGNDVDRVGDVAAVFKKINDDVYILDYSPETTELLKLMSTSKLAWDVLFEKEVHRLCEKYGVPFEIVYTDATKSYNAGYQSIKQKQFTRPVLEHVPGGIGGHCTIKNCEVFPETYINQLILDKNKNFSLEVIDGS